MRKVIPWLMCAALGAGCAVDGAEPIDGENDSFFAGGKADTGGIADGSPEARAVLRVANESSYHVLNHDAHLAKKSAANIVAWRAGDDGVEHTPPDADDRKFNTLQELDDVPFVGPLAFQQLLTYAKAHGYLRPQLHGTLVAGGDSFACGIKDDGAEVCWGYDYTAYLPSPANTKFTTLGTGLVHTCGVTEAGSVTCWGNDLTGESDPPKTPMTAVAGATQFSCGLQLDGSIVCWGFVNYKGVTAPPGHYVSIDAGGTRACAVRSDGALICWKADGTEEPVPGTFTQVAVGQNDIACAVETDGSVRCWDGPLVPPRGKFSSVSVGYSHACGVRTDGTIVCWGNSNALGDSGPPAGTFVEVACGDFFTCGLRSDGKVLCWGQQAAYVQPPDVVFQH